MCSSLSFSLVIVSLESLSNFSVNLSYIWNDRSNRSGAFEAGRLLVTVAHSSLEKSASYSTQRILHVPRSLHVLYVRFTSSYHPLFCWKGKLNKHMHSNLNRRSNSTVCCNKPRSQIKAQYSYNVIDHFQVMPGRNLFLYWPNNEFARRLVVQAHNLIKSRKNWLNASVEAASFAEPRLLNSSTIQRLIAFVSFPSNYSFYLPRNIEYTLYTQEYVLNFLYLV